MAPPIGRLLRSPTSPALPEAREIVLVRVIRGKPRPSRCRQRPTLLSWFGNRDASSSLTLSSWFVFSGLLNRDTGIADTAAHAAAASSAPTAALMSNSGGS